MFKWLKNYMPRSLYGRAALILITPVLFVQIAVSITFLQDHFSDVTRQMTQGVVINLRYVLPLLEAEGLGGVGEAAARSLQYDVQTETPIARDTRLFYDISGRSVIATLREGLDVIAVDLASNDRMVHVWLASDQLADPDLSFRFSFERARVSAANPHQLLVWMIVVGILIFLISLIFLRNQLRPITRLAHAAEAFGRGEVTHYSPGGALEVRAAGTSFLAMRARIERQIEQRTLMLSGVSHDLRTPLTRMQLGLELMEEDTADLQQDVNEMQRMVDEFLSFARGNAGETPKRCDMVALVDTLVKAHERNGALLRFEVQGAPELVAIRPVAVRRALDNLISNARRYGSEAVIKLAFLDRSVRIRVEDNGPGVPESKRTEAMRPFARLEPARNQNKGSGVGLGLAIAADVARVHGGTLRLGDSAEMGGLCADLILAR